MMISKTKISAEGFEKVEITAKMAEVFGLPKKAVGEWAVVSKEYFVVSLEKGSFRRIFCRRQVQQSSAHSQQNLGRDVWLKAFR